MIKTAFSEVEAGEIKDIAQNLAQEKDWSKHKAPGIIASITLLCGIYPGYVDAQIKDTQEYGCGVRERAFMDMSLVYGIAFPDIKKTESDTLLASRLALWHSNVPGFTEVEDNCFGRIRALAEARTNACRIEERYLRENRDLKYLEGAFPYTRECHDMLRQLRKEMRLA